MISMMPPGGDRSGLRRKFLIIIGLIIIVAVVLLLKIQRQVPTTSQVEQGKRSQESSIASHTSSKNEFSEQHLSEPLPRLIDLGADKCIPCKMMAPILEELKTEYRGKFTVEFIDVWKDPQAGRQWRIRIIPTQIFVDGAGKELFRHEGFFSKEDILKKWKELGVDVDGRRDGHE
jgi:thioredoxin 1